MSNAARSFGRTTLVALAIVAPALLLAGCGKSSEETLDNQIAVAKEAAERAESAQKAAEKAAKVIAAQAPPGAFGDDEDMSEFSDESDSESESFESESSDPTDSTSDMDVSGGDGMSSEPVPN